MPLEYLAPHLQMLFVQLIYACFLKLKIPVSITLRNPWGVDGGGSHDGSNDGLITLTGHELLGSIGGVTSAWV